MDITNLNNDVELDELDIELDELDDLEITELSADFDIDDIDIEAALPKLTGRQDELGTYLQDINRFPMLTQQEEVDLAKVMTIGKEAARMLTKDNQAELTPLIIDGQFAREKFINANYKLVVAVAKHYAKSVTASITFLDIIQSGNLGLMTAVDRFDYTKGFKFSTYATWWIRQRIRRDIINTAQTIRVPVHVQDWLSRIYNLQQQMPNISISEIANQLNLTKDKVDRLLQIQAERSVIYLDRALHTEDADGAFLDVLPSDTMTPDNMHKLEALDEYVLEILLTRLTDREQYVITRRFGLLDNKPATLEVIAKEFDLTRERIRQIESKALRKLRAARVQNDLRDYLQAK